MMDLHKLFFFKQLCKCTPSTPSVLTDVDIRSAGEGQIHTHTHTRIKLPSTGVCRLCVKLLAAALEQ